MMAFAADSVATPGSAETFFSFLLQLAAGVVVIVAICMVYFLPYTHAKRSGHHNAEAIGVLNLLLGWTLIGWIAALVWSATKRPEAD